MNKKIELAETKDLIDFLVERIGEKPVLVFLQELMDLDMGGDIKKAKENDLLLEDKEVRNWLEQTVVSLPNWENDFCYKSKGLYSNLEEIPQEVKDKFLEDAFNLSKGILEKSLKEGTEDNDDEPHYCFELLAPFASVRKEKQFWSWYNKL